ncbi:MAG TPA: PaaI family thioesterase [Candidatus Acidoferrum sp.]
MAILARMVKELPFQGVHLDFAQRVLDSFERQGLMKHLGSRIAQLQPGRVEIRVAHRAELTQQHNYFHAGVSGAIADSACGYAAYTLLPAILLS